MFIGFLNTSSSDIKEQFSCIDTWLIRYNILITENKLPFNVEVLPVGIQNRYDKKFNTALSDPLEKGYLIVSVIVYLAS
jgi:hypothetical protein